MIQTLALATGLIVVAGVAFVASLRLGMLVGLRLDRLIEARASASLHDDSDAGAESSSEPLQDERAASQAKPGGDER